MRGETRCDAVETKAEDRAKGRWRRVKHASRGCNWLIPRLQRVHTFKVTPASGLLILILGRVELAKNHKKCGLQETSMVVLTHCRPFTDTKLKATTKHASRA